jgi:hypothetical protein
MECNKVQFFDLFLFLLYMYEVLLNIQGAKMVLFADYTNVLVIYKDVDALRQKLNRVM